MTTRRPQSPKPTPHTPEYCKRIGPQHYHYRSWSDRFECPVCGRTRRYNLNYLGHKAVLCRGDRFATMRMAEYEEAREAMRASNGVPIEDGEDR